MKLILIGFGPRSLKEADAVFRKQVITTIIKRNKLKYRRVQRNTNE